MSAVERVFTTVTLVGLVATFLLFLPVQLGGSTAYLTIVGRSMEPTFSEGDLVVLRAADRYDVGDAVAYHSSTAELVLHRIVGRDGHRFVLQGDNNEWLDSDRPTAEAIVGKETLRLPRLGRWLSALQRPRHLAVGAAVVSFLAAGGMPLLARRSPHRPNRRTRSHPMSSDASRPSTGFPRQAPPHPRPRPAGGQRSLEPAARVPSRRPGTLRVGALAVGALLAAVALTAGTFMLPVERSALTETVYTHVGQFAYEAAAEGAAYNGGLRSGDPVFSRVVDHIDVVFTYHPTADGPVEATGTYRLDVQLSDSTGWSQRLPLVNRTAFDRAPVSVAAVLDLNVAHRALQRLESATEVAPRNPHVTVVAEVEVSTDIDGVAHEDIFVAELPFAYQPLVLTLAAGNPDELLETRTAAVADHRSMQPMSISVGPVDVTLAQGRWVVPAGVIVALLVAGLRAQRRRALARLDEPDRIRRLHSARLLPVAGPPVAVDRTVEVQDFASLWRVAEHHDRMILHATTLKGDAYYVDDGYSILAYHLEGVVPAGPRPDPPTAVLTVAAR